MPNTIQKGSEKFFRTVVNNKGDKLDQKMFWCPACACAHFITSGWSLTWSDGKPTVSPSVLVRSVINPNPILKDENGKHILGEDGRLKGARDSVCHLFIKNGEIQYLGDCTHEMANKTILMEKF